MFNQALSKRYGAAKSLEDYVRKAQLMNYEAQRAMFEAYSQRKYTSTTGVVQWLLNNAWPSLIWHLYGYDFSLAGGYFGAKKANEPVHIQYSYDDRSIVVVNQTQEAAPGLTASVRVYDRESQERFALDFPVAIAADSAAKVTALPEIERLSNAYFLKVSLLKGTTPVSLNWYWLSRKPDVSDFKRSDWGGTPVTQFADFTDLAGLPPATIKATATAKEGQALRVEIQNTSPVIAFFVRLKLARSVDGVEILPALWQDNYVSLLAGEKRVLEVSYSGTGALRGGVPSVEISGWNVNPTKAALGTAQKSSGVTP